MPPAVVGACEAASRRTRDVAGADRLPVEPLPAADEASLRDGWARFIELMRETRPANPPAFYRLVRLGRLEMGVGSALEPKTLLRIAGPTAVRTTT